jgi:hypothetical protein
LLWNSLAKKGVFIVHFKISAFKNKTMEYFEYKFVPHMISCKR